MKYKVTVPVLKDPINRVWWCNLNIGVIFCDWTADIVSGKNKNEVDYFFKKEEDALIFSLRWSGQDK
jgi:hypothetical protein